MKKTNKSLKQNYVVVTPLDDGGSYSFPAASFSFWLLIYESMIANIMYYLTCYGVLKPG